MLSFDLNALAAKAVTVDSFLSPSDEVWQEEDQRPSGPVRVTGRISAAGAGRFYWSGRIHGPVRLDCRRCLEEVTAQVEENVHVLFAEPGDEGAEDPDVYLLDPRARDLDLRPALREQWLLSLPTFALCREDCRGLCPTCGADRNAIDCNCPPRIDSRWEALRSARRDAERS